MRPVAHRCGPARRQKIVVGSKFFTEQVLLAELLAQHIEARTGIFVERKTNLGGTLLVHKAMLAGKLDFYVEYTGTALTAVLNETPSGGAQGVYERVKQEYAQRFGLEVGAPLGFEWPRNGARGSATNFSSARTDSQACASAMACGSRRSRG